MPALGKGSGVLLQPVLVRNPMSKRYLWTIWCVITIMTGCLCDFINQGTRRKMDTRSAPAHSTIGRSLFDYKAQTCHLRVHLDFDFDLRMNDPGGRLSMSMRLNVGDGFAGSFCDSEQRIFAGLGIVPSFNRWRGRAKNNRTLIKFGPNHCKVSGVVAHAIPLFV